MDKVSLIGGTRNGMTDIVSEDDHSEKLRTASSLLIRGASPLMDEGRYTCSPSDGTIEVSTTLHVIEG